MNKLTVLGLFTYVLSAVMSFAMCKWECGIAWTCSSLMTVVLMLEERRNEQEKEEFAIILFVYRFANLVYRDRLEKLSKESGDKPNGKDKE